MSFFCVIKVLFSLGGFEVINTILRKKDAMKSSGNSSRLYSDDFVFNQFEFALFSLGGFEVINTILRKKDAMKNSSNSSPLYSDDFVFNQI